MVVLVSVAFLVVPFRLVIGGMREVMSMSPPADIQAELRACVEEVEKRHRIQESFVRAAKVGGRMDIEIDFVLGPESTVVTVADTDAVRSDLHERLAALGYERSLVVTFTTDRRWAELSAPLMMFWRQVTFVNIPRSVQTFAVRAVYTRYSGNIPRSVGCQRVRLLG